MRSNFPHAALRLWPRRLAICAALRPLAQSFLRSATSSASQLMGYTYMPIANNRLVGHAGDNRRPFEKLVVEATGLRDKAFAGDAQI
jgi:hypothetical protein